MARPNIIIILADDLGFSDISPFGGDIDTPSLERLTARGTRMSSYYVTPRCSPSRAALLTGCHPHSVGIGILTTDHRPNGYPGTLSTEAPTLAERLKDEGYATGIFGKWHLATDVSTPNDAWPTRRGFDEFRGFLPGASSYENPPIVEGERPVPADELADDFYFTDDVTASGVDFVHRHAGNEDPFFLFLTYTAPHWPLQAAEADIAKYRARYRQGWTKTRADRLRGVQDAGIVPGVGRLPTDPALPEWPEQDREWQIERMAVYAAQVESLDRGIGRILDQLDASGAADDTLVMFFSDNGGCSEELPAGQSIFNELVCPPQTRSGERVLIGNDPQIMPGPANTYQSYGEQWATVSNTPFRMWKRWVHEGGISTPFIASWPAGGIATGGGISRATGHVIDIVPTVLDAVGASPQATEGESILPHLREPTEGATDRVLFWEHIGNAAVRRGQYKLVREWGGAWELYDIVADRIESNNLAAEKPELVAELLAEYEDWAISHGVIPWEDVLADHDARGVPRIYAMG